MISTLSKLSALSITVMIAGYSHASAIIDLRLEGGGTAQVYELNNGNYLSLWGFDNRGNSSPVTINSASDITQGFTVGGSSIVNYYNGTNPINAGASEFDPLLFPFTVDEDIVGNSPRLFDSLWIESSSEVLVYQRVSGGTDNLNVSGQNTEILDGDPLGTVIPTPGATVMAVLGLGALAMRRRRA